MDKNIVFPIESEILQNDELCKLTGRMLVKHQIAWLTANGWKFHLSALGSPIVGTWYARMKLAGIEPSDLSAGGLTDRATLVKEDELFHVIN
ncbi:MAG: DUF4224 domain-containing protein [Pseudomonadota bacterium]